MFHSGVVIAFDSVVYVIMFDSVVCVIVFGSVVPKPSQEKECSSAICNWILV